MDHDAQRAFQELAKVVDERLGTIIGVAAVVSTLPETARLSKGEVGRQISALCRSLPFAATNLSSAAMKSATAVLALAQKLEGDRRAAEHRSGQTAVEPSGDSGS